MVSVKALIFSYPGLTAALAEVGDVGAANDAARGLIKLLARPSAPVRTAVGVQQLLEPLRYVQRAPLA